ncbi:MAG: OmpA family protein [Thalassotalea sp.]
MKKLTLSLITSALLIAGATNANEQPQAQDLVGKFYGGLHYNLNKPDEDRLNGIPEDFELGDGFGIEAGYRFTKSTEFRLSFTDMSIEFENGTADQDGDALSFDVLYFPTEQNYYVLGGINNLEILNDTEISANLGLGYRHYFSERLAAYAEVKAHYQFDNKYIDQSGQIGLIYFFGDSAKATPAKVIEAPKAAPQPVAAKPVVAKPKDSDNDGVFDNADKCPNTPASDKVDSLGCTIFTDEELSQQLLINFDNNQAVIKPNFVSEAAKIADFLAQYPHINMTIEGHTSSQGSAAYNQTLSQKRADAVVALLVSKFNVEKSRLTAVGYGETRLINSANTAAAHAENRRIEANVSVTKKVKVSK